MAIEQALAELKETESAEAFSLQNSKLLKVELSAATIQAKLGSMVAYQGDVSFEHAGSGGMGRMLKKAVSGEGTQLTGAVQVRAEKTDDSFAQIGEVGVAAVHRKRQYCNDVRRGVGSKPLAVSRTSSTFTMHVTAPFDWQVVSNTGSWMQSIAQAWLVLRLARAGSPSRTALSHTLIHSTRPKTTVLSPSRSVADHPAVRGSPPHAVTNCRRRADRCCSRW